MVPAVAAADSVTVTAPNLTDAPLGRFPPSASTVIDVAVAAVAAAPVVTVPAKPATVCVTAGVMTRIVLTVGVLLL